MPLAVPVPPVTPAIVQNPFSPAAQDWLAAHRGVDLAARPGQQVAAPVRGKVVFSGTIAGREVLTLRSGATKFSFEPIAAVVKRGQRVRRGQVLGQVSRGGHCDGRCLHWGARVDGAYVDPMSYLPQTAPVLKPPVTHRPSAVVSEGRAATCCVSGSRDSP